MPRILNLAGVILICAACEAAAQDAVDALLAERPVVQAPVRQTQAVPLDAPAVDKPPEDPEVAVTRRLNAEIDARNQAVRESNAAARADYDRRLRDHAEWLDRLDREHQAEQAAHEAEARRRLQAHEADLAAWRRRVEACRAGDHSQCAQPLLD